MSPLTELAVGSSAHLIGSMAVGRGLRLNNPYRLQTQLGDTAESLSLTAYYFDIALGATLGAHDSWQQGAVVHVSLAIDGMPQQVVTPSYLALYRLDRRWTLLSRVGMPLVISPDSAIAWEAGLGVMRMLRAGFGLIAELSYSVFYGAATEQTNPTVIPIVALQLGVLWEHEVLP